MSSLVIQKDFENIPVMWKPTENENLHMIQFWKYINKKYNQKIDNYWDLHEWTIKNVPAFWAEIWDYSGMVYSKKYDEIIDLTVSMADTPVWFKGSRTNYAENLLKYRDDHVAIIAGGEDREMKKYTYSALYREVCRYGAALKKLGLTKNESVACYMSNREEAIFSVLSVTAAGATWSAVSPFYGAKAAIERFRQVNPKFIFTVDKYLWNGEENDMLENLKTISEGLPSLEKIVIAPYKDSSLNRDISKIRNSCFLNEFLASGLEADGSVPELEFQQLPFNHPVFITYTSGTTGVPKSLIHGPGCILTAFRDNWLHFGVTRNSVWFLTSTPGWATWSVCVNTFALGLTLIVYEDLPILHPTSVWDMIDKYHITHWYVPVLLLDELERRGYVPTEKHHLSSLRMLMSAGSVCRIQNFDFAYERIKPDLMFGAVYGTSEIFSCALLPERTLPVYKGEISAPALGTDARCFNDQGQAVEGEIGEFVILTLSPSFPLSILNDDDGSKYRNTYFSKFPEAIAHGDICFVNPATKGIVICGRSDSKLSPFGKLFTSADIYNIVNIFPEIHDSLCVSQYNELGNERVILFLKMRQGHVFTDDLVLHIRKSIEKELTLFQVPEIILEIADIPHNPNGKKMEVIVKKIINKMPYNPETVVNQECLALYENIPELQDYK